VCTEFWSKRLKGRHHLEDLNIVGRVFTLTLKICGVAMWTKLVWLKIGMTAMQVKHEVNRQVRKLLDSRADCNLGCANDRSA
jgi:hypothetical protein